MFCDRIVCVGERGKNKTKMRTYYQVLDAYITILIASVSSLFNYTLDLGHKQSSGCVINTYFNFFSFLVINYN